ncbi:MAG: phosphodiester glycosidase family protein [Parasporobacterium sp.]|nr:phosphodiester glycosidase family protein [Parasporobacterium sp.]
MKKKHLAEIGYIFLLTAFTVYLILDTFVISSAFQENAVQMNTAIFTQLEETSRKEEIEENDTSAVLSEFAEAGIASAQSYEDENISITISEYEELGTHIYVADVVLASAQYLKTAFAQDTYGKNITDPTSVIASEHDAILAINGDYYGSQESGYVIRNGIVYREAGNGENIVCIYADGSMQIVDSDDITAEELVEQGVWQAFCFGPELLEEGQIVISKEAEVGKAKASNPRTALGIIDNNHFVFVVSDGRTEESEGLSLYELASFMKSLGVTTAYNLDGGGSSTMVFQDVVINNPTSGGRIAERSISDIIYIG